MKEGEEVDSGYGGGYCVGIDNDEVSRDKVNGFSSFNGTKMMEVVMD